MDIEPESYINPTPESGSSRRAFLAALLIGGGVLAAPVIASFAVGGSTKVSAGAPIPSSTTEGSNETTTTEGSNETTTTEGSNETTTTEGSNETTTTEGSNETTTTEGSNETTTTMASNETTTTMASNETTTTTTPGTTTTTTPATTTTTTTTTPATTTTTTTTAGRTPALVSPATSSPGATITAEVTGFIPGEKVTFILHSDPITLGSGIADPSGSLVKALVIPKSASAGAHQIEAVGSVTTALLNPIVLVASALPPTR